MEKLVLVGDGGKKQIEMSCSKSRGLCQGGIEEKADAFGRFGGRRLHQQQEVEMAMIPGQPEGGRTGVSVGKRQAIGS